MNANTVFGYLALRFATHPENLATEALSFILNNSHAASRGFTTFIRQIMPDCPEGLRFDTQQAGLERAIPDMKCNDSKGMLRLIIENKFWAGLTANQPVTYIRELSDGITATVLFVVPEARRQLIWNEVEARCVVAGIPLNRLSNSEDFRAAEIREGHYLAETSWEALLTALSSAATLAADTECLNDIAQLMGLCRTMDAKEFLPLRPEELSSLETARRIVGFCDLPFEIIAAAESQRLCDKAGREVPTRYGSGRYAQIGDYTVWVGFDARQWNRLGSSPIWVNFYPDYCPTDEVRGQLIRFRNARPQRCFDMDIGSYRWIAVPIVLADSVEKHRIVENAVDQIRELRNELGATKQPSLGSNPAIEDGLVAKATTIPAPEVAL